MLKVKEVENIDDLDDVKVLSLVVGNVPKKFIREAKEIDGRNYSSDCFGIWVNYEVETGELVVITTVLACFTIPLWLFILKSAGMF